MECTHKTSGNFAHTGSPQSRIRSRGLWIVPLLAAVCVICVPAKAQYFLINPTSTAGVQANGLHIYSVSVFSAYSTAALPNGADTASSGLAFPGLLHSGFDVTTGGAITVGWGKSFKKSTMSVMYSPSYMRHTRYSQWSSLAQSLAMSWSTSLGAHWSWSAGIAAATTSSDVILFRPNQMLNLATVPATFDNLSSAVISGRTADPQLTGALNASGAGIAPQDELIFGRRMLATSVNTSVTYARSTRFTISGGLSGTRAQHLGSSDPADAFYIIPRMTSAGADVNVSYALTPRTTTSVSVAMARTFTGLVTANTYSFSAALGRKMGEHWFLSGSAGAGVTKPQFSIQRIQYIGTAAIGYKTYGHTFVGSVNRTMADSYGIGGMSTIASSGAWNWSRPGRTWGTVVAVSQNKVLGGVIGTSGNQFSAGIHRAFSHHSGLVLQYGYGRSVAMLGGLYGYAYPGGGTPGSQFRFTHHSVRLAFSWSPQIIINPIPGQSDN